MLSNIECLSRTQGRTIETLLEPWYCRTGPGGTCSEDLGETEGDEGKEEEREEDDEQLMSYVL